MNEAMNPKPDQEAQQAAARKLVNDFARACVYGSDGERITAGDALVAALSAPPKPQAPAPDYSDMSREALERHATRMAQALHDDKARAFYDKHALGPMMVPSCLVCGQLPEVVAIQHMELPGVVVCEKCRTAAKPQAPAVAEAPCPMCRGVGSHGEPPIACQWCRLHKTASKLLEAIDDQHSGNSPPHKYGVPYAAVNELRAAIAATKEQGDALQEARPL